MAKTIGFACSIRLQWLKKAIQLLEDNPDEAAYKQELNEYLSFEIASPTRLRKTREILMNIWFYDDEVINPFRKEALELITKYPDYIVPINLCLIYLAYPVVADICKYMGRIFEYYDEVTNATLKQKLYDEWGERGTLETTSRRVTLTLKELGILSDVTRTRYQLNKMEITNVKVVAFILAAAMRIDGNSYYAFSELYDFDVLFPYEYAISKEHLLTDPHFSSTQFGGGITFCLK